MPWATKNETSPLQKPIRYFSIFSKNESTTQLTNSLTTISPTTLRRFILGKQGLWPGRRWSGFEGAAQALQAIEAVQIDPLTVVARSHDIALWGRVAGYQPEQLAELMYVQRRFFDFGGALYVYPIAELPYWRTYMRRSLGQGRVGGFAMEHPEVVEEVRAAIRERGPLSSRGFEGNQRVERQYRGSKDTSIALYALWITGELMIHHREGSTRFYDLRERIAPPELDYAVPVREAEQFFARKEVSFHGLMRERDWRSAVGGDIHRKIDRDEGQVWLERLLAEGTLAAVQAQGMSDRFLALPEDLPLLRTLESGQVPAAWQPLGPTTTDEVVFLAPLEIVSARGRAAWLFNFDYVWEIYKPVHTRRWGYYTLPILWGDRLVARIDPKLDRANKTLLIKGFWYEQGFPADSAEREAFASAFACGLRNFAAFHNAAKVDTDALPEELKRKL